MAISHDENDEGLSYAEFRFSFPEGGTGQTIMAGIESHIHDVPPRALVEAMMTAIQHIIAQSLADDVVSDAFSPEQQQEARLMMARQYIKAMLAESTSQVVDAGVVRIPDDASELFND